MLALMPTSRRKITLYIVAVLLFAASIAGTDGSCAFIVALLMTFAASCSGLTKLTSLSGIITEGSGAYSSNMACQWLISVPSANAPITLSFLSLNTEASYDYVCCVKQVY